MALLCPSHIIFIFSFIKISNRRAIIEKSGNCSLTASVDSLYCGHPWNCKLVSLIARVCNSGNLFQSNVCTLFWPGIKLIAVVCIIKVSTRQELTVHDLYKT